MMKTGDKVVYIETDKTQLKCGETYTIRSISRDFFGDDLLYLEGIDTGYFYWRFRSLEEMQNTNFIQVAKKGSV
jgi:hypothetical protein